MFGFDKTRTPSLPQRDQDTDARTSALNSQREDYGWNHENHGLPRIAKLSRHEKFSVPYMLNALELARELAVNRSKFKHIMKDQGARIGWIDELKAKITDNPDAVDFDWDGSLDQVDGVPNTRPDSVDQGYLEQFIDLPVPEIAAVWREDRAWAYQALAGANPVMIRGARSVPPNFAVTPALYQRAIGGTFDSLDAALAEGRVYISDYKTFENCPAGITTDLQKVLYAPLVMYAWLPAHAGQEAWFAPIAVQLGQRPGPESPIFTPQDGMHWQMAKVAAAGSDGNFQGAIAHMTYCHIVIEAVLIAACRNLAPNHPLMVLLAPSFENTLATNEFMYGSILVPGGNLDQLQSGTYEGTMDVAAREYFDFDFARNACEVRFEDRGVADTEALPLYPMRDDARLVNTAHTNFAAAYVGLYYQSDADVVADGELTRWIAEMGAKDGGGIKNIGEIQTVAALTDLVAHILFRITTYHASINYSGYDHLAYSPNLMTSIFGSAALPSEEATEAKLLEMMPPRNVTALAIHMMWQQKNTCLNKVGGYDVDDFKDERTHALLKAYQAELAQADATIDERNAARPKPYLYLMPKYTPLSIHV